MQQIATQSHLQFAHVHGTVEVEQPVLHLEVNNVSWLFWIADELPSRERRTHRRDNQEHGTSFPEQSLATVTMGLTREVPAVREVQSKSR